MEGLLEKIAYCVEYGKINKNAPYPPDLKDQDGADELTRQALDQGLGANDILTKGLVTGMEKIVFVPQVLMSAKAMSTAMEHLKPFFQSGAVKRKGTFLIGVVAGDLHDIGKNLVSMMIEGNGWEVIDLGTDVKTEKYIEAIKNYSINFLGLSALLTTTMVNMKNTVKEIKAALPDIKILIGGAPVNEEFRVQIGADFYSPDPQGAVEYLNKHIA